MGKKKKILKKVNPERSNKMIIAVAIGLFMVFGGFIYFTVSSNPIEKRHNIINSECERLQKYAGVISATGNEKSIKIIVDTEAHEDYKGVAVFSGEKLSTTFPGENIKITVKDNNNKVLFRLTFRNGRTLHASGMSSLPAS